MGEEIKVNVIGGGWCHCSNFEQELPAAAEEDSSSSSPPPRKGNLCWADTLYLFYTGKYVMTFSTHINRFRMHGRLREGEGEKKGSSEPKGGDPSVPYVRRYCHFANNVTRRGIKTYKT